MSGSTAASSSAAGNPRLDQPGEDSSTSRSAADRRGELVASPYEGFWAPMDTIKDKQHLDALSNRPRAVAQGRAARDASRGRTDARTRRFRRSPLRACCDRLSSRRHRDRMRRDDPLADRARPDVDVTWVVLAAHGERARRGAGERAISWPAGPREVVLHEFRDGLLRTSAGRSRMSSRS